MQGVGSGALRVWERAGLVTFPRCPPLPRGGQGSCYMAGPSHPVWRVDGRRSCCLGSLRWARCSLGSVVMSACMLSAVMNGVEVSSRVMAVSYAVLTEKWVCNIAVE